MENEIKKEIEKIANRYHKNMQLEMQRFANAIMKLKFKEEDKE